MQTDKRSVLPAIITELMISCVSEASAAQNSPVVGTYKTLELCSYFHSDARYRPFAVVHELQCFYPNTFKYL